MIVRKYQGESDMHLILRFKSKVFRDGLLREAMAKMRFLKPSEKRKLKQRRRIEELKNLT